MPAVLSCCLVSSVCIVIGNDLSALPFNKAEERLYIKEAQNTTLFGVAAILSCCGCSASLYGGCGYVSKGYLDGWAAAGMVKWLNI